jgi:hypothetical protein
MKKISLALTLGTGLTLGLAAPSAQADALLQQNLGTPTITASQFNSRFTADGAPIASPFGVEGAPNAGTILSQRFVGHDETAGLVAYAYQIGVNSNATDAYGAPVQVNSASFHFNNTPANTADLGLVPNGPSFIYAYSIKDGHVGGLNMPQASPGEQILAPTQLNWLPGSTTGSITAQYFDSSHNPLSPGANSATFVVMTSDSQVGQFSANIQASAGNVGALTKVVAPEGGRIESVPIPEPTTILAWAGVLGGVALVQRVRKNRAVIA